uniref:C2H2-type domain-containing protein n=1 Tax=Meloidogyne javanica TaxID=6303 RepID=A0A915N3W2_MELJA
MFNCTECNKSFSTKYNRNRHLKTIHKIDLEEADREIQRPVKNNKKRKMEERMGPGNDTITETDSTVKKSIKYKRKFKKMRILATSVNRSNVTLMLQLKNCKEQLEEETNKNKLLIEDLRNAVSIKEMELLSQTKILTETNNKLDELNAKTEQCIVEKDKETHEYKRVIDQLRLENEKLQSNFERDIFEQEKLRLQDEINTYMTRDKAHLEKQASLYDEIQELLKRIEFMERLQHTIASPSPNVSETMSTFSPITRLSTTGIEASTQQHTERKNAIIGYMRTDKQKETELCMSAELELQRIRAKSTVDQQKILQLESEIAKLTNEVELNAKTEQRIVEKDKETNEYKRVIDQLRLENEKLQSDFERVNSNCTDFSENNLRLTTDLAKEISKTETLTQQIVTLEKDCQDKCEKFQKWILNKDDCASPNTLSSIINYWRKEREKENLIRIEVEYSLKKYRERCIIGEEKIIKLESEIAKLTNELEINAKIAVEKEELLTQLNFLREVQNRYQQIKKSFDELNERFTSTNVLAQGLEVEQAKLIAEKTELNFKLENVTKLSNDRAQQIKLLKESYDQAMAMASKYSPEIVNSLQGDIDKLKLDMAQKENDVGILKKECDRLTEELKKTKDEHNTLTAEYTKATATHKATHESLLMVKVVARKIREEKIKLSAENEKLQDELMVVQDQLLKTRDSVAAAAVSSSNAEAVSTIQAERKEYQTKIEVSTQQIKELEAQRDELLIKIEMVEKAYKNSQEKIRQMGSEIKKLKEENEQLSKFEASEICEGIIGIDDIPVAAVTEPASSTDPPVKAVHFEQQQVEQQLLEKTQDFASAEFHIQTGTDGLNEISSGENIPVSYDGNKREGEGDDNLGLKNVVEVRN